MQKPNKWNFVRQILAGVIAFSLILTACAANTSVPTATDTLTPIPPTQTPTGTPEPTPTPSVAPPDVHDETWDSDHIQAQKLQWEAWIRYWLGATNPPIPADITELRYEILTDPSDPPQGANDPRLNEKAVLLLTWHDPNDKTKLVRAFLPLNTTEGGFQAEPPTVESPYEIEEGNEPFLLTDGADRPLAWRGNGFVRIDPVSGLAREVVDKNGEWVPAYGVEVIKPETYTAEQLAQIANSPTVLKDNLPLNKGFAAGPFSDRMMYFGAGNEVKAVYDAETDKAHPAMMMNSGKMLVINEKGRSEMLLNPLTPDAPDVVHILPEYWRWRVCNIKAPMPKSLQEVDMSPDGKTCNAYVRPASDEDYNNVPGLYLDMTAETPIIIRGVSEQGNTYITQRNAANSQLQEGFGYFKNDLKGLEMIFFYSPGFFGTTPENLLARDIYQPLVMLLDRIREYSRGPAGRDPLFEKFLINNGDYRGGRGGNLNAPVPVIYGPRLKVEQ